MSDSPDECRVHRNLPEVAVPAVAVLDPEGDIARHLAATGRGRPHPGWAPPGTFSAGVAGATGTDPALYGDLKVLLGPDVVPQGLTQPAPDRDHPRR